MEQLKSVLILLMHGANMNQVTESLFLTHIPQAEDTEAYSIFWCKCICDFKVPWKWVLWTSAISLPLADIKQLEEHSRLQHSKEHTDRIIGWLTTDAEVM